MKNQTQAVVVSESVTPVGRGEVMPSAMEIRQAQSNPIWGSDVVTFDAAIEAAIEKLGKQAGKLQDNIHAVINQIATHYNTYGDSSVIVRHASALVKTLPKGIMVSKIKAWFEEFGKITVAEGNLVLPMISFNDKQKAFSVGLPEDDAIRQEIRKTLETRFKDDMTGKGAHSLTDFPRGKGGAPVFWHQIKVAPPKDAITLAAILEYLEKADKKIGNMVEEVSECEQDKAKEIQQAFDSLKVAANALKTGATKKIRVEAQLETAEEDEESEEG